MQVQQAAPDSTCSPRCLKHSTRMAPLDNDSTVKDELDVCRTAHERVQVQQATPHSTLMAAPPAVKKHVGSGIARRRAHAAPDFMDACIAMKPLLQPMA
jgi:hypothetical protein